MEEGAACLEGARPSEPWSHLPSGTQAADLVIVLLLQALVAGPMTLAGRLLGTVTHSSTGVPVVSSLKDSFLW